MDKFKLIKLKTTPLMKLRKKMRKANHTTEENIHKHVSDKELVPRKNS